MKESRSCQTESQRVLSRQEEVSKKKKKKSNQYSVKCFIRITKGEDQGRNFGLGLYLKIVSIKCCGREE